MGCSCKSCASFSSCCSASEVATGGLAGVTEDFFLARVRLGACGCGIVCCTRGDAVTGFVRNKHSAQEKRIGSAKNLRAGIFAAAEENAPPPRALPASKLAPRNWRGIGIFAQGRWVSLAQDFDHPVIEVIDRMDQD